MALLTHPMFDEHEQVVHCHDQRSGLKAIIAIHDTRRGPAVGGCRMWHYPDEADALTDVLRLSRGMTFKNALADLPFGGGKCVILGEQKSPELWQAFAGYLNSLGGRYITAEDVGISVDDIAEVGKYTSHVAGLKSRGGDPSPFTALGVFEGIKASLAHRYSHPPEQSLKGLRVAVQGVGHVGYHLCKQLHQAGAKLWLSDVNQRQLDKVASEFGAQIVAPEDIYALDVDVYAPCALGATLNDSTIDQLKAKIVAGSANNQLAEPRHDVALQAKGVLYAPDYVINAGGIINVYFEQQGHYSAERARERVRQIGQTLEAIFQDSDQSKRPTGQVADNLAKAKLAQGDQARWFNFLPQ